eukprot:GHVQ01030514.1.p1 GENE.GHVQ01030514.1~~GHVQ01030514.1.p1  ORF type:complete len:345 (+),score=37.35 GHVQ01030514.1:1198-2232(+)
MHLSLLLDSACSSHMLNSPKWFTSLTMISDADADEEITCANGTKSSINGRGQACLLVKTHDGSSVQVLLSAAYTPDHNTNLLSMGDAWRNGHTCTIYGSVPFLLLKDGVKINLLPTSNKLFVVPVIGSSRASEVAASAGISAGTWHRRLGHTCLRALVPVLQINWESDSDPDNQVEPPPHPEIPPVPPLPLPNDIVKPPVHETPPLRRHPRDRRPPGQLADFFVGSVSDCVIQEPRNYKEAISCPQALAWKEAMDYEAQALNKNDTWKLQTLPVGAKLVSGTWTYKVKRKANRNLDKFRARYCTRIHTGKGRRLRRNLCSYCQVLHHSVSIFHSGATRSNHVAT